MADKTIRENFFEAKAVGALWDVAVSIKRGNPLPLDSNAVFASYADLETYAAGPVAYPGHVVAVVNEDSTNLYYLDQNLAIQPVGAADTKSIDFADGKLEIKGFKAADSLTLPQKQANGTIAWVPISQIVEGDGNTITTVGATDKSIEVNLINDDESERAYEVKVNVSEVENNQLTLKNDGLYVAAYDDTKVKEDISKKANTVDVYTKTETNGLLANKADASTVYTKEEANNLFGGAFHFRGEKNSYEELEAIVGKSTGDVYQVDDKEYAWDGTKWVELGFNIDLSEYAKKGESYTKGEADLLLNAKADTEDVYNKTEIDGFLAEKAAKSVVDDHADRIDDAETAIADINNNLGDRYTKEETNNLLAGKVDNTTLLDYIKTTEVNKTLENYATNTYVNEELGKKLDASKLTDINNAINAKLDSSVYDADKTTFATKQEVNETIGQAPTRTEGEDGEVNWEGATGIYTNIYTKDEITDLIADITGGESAADVLAALNAYKTSTDPRIKALEEVGAEKNLLEIVKVGGTALEIDENKAVNIPIGGAALGVVKTTTVENGVAINADGTMAVNNVNANKLVQTEGEYIILYGGSSTDLI